MINKFVVHSLIVEDRRVFRKKSARFRAGWHENGLAVSALRVAFAERPSWALREFLKVLGREMVYTLTGREVRDRHGDGRFSHARIPIRVPVWTRGPERPITESKGTVGETDPQGESA